MSIDRAAFLKALQICSPAVARPGNRAVELCNFWFSDGFVSAYNGRLGIFAPSSTEIRGGVQGKLLDWLDKAQGDQVDITTTTKSLSIKVGKAKANFPLLEPERQVLTVDSVIEMMPENSIQVSKEFTDGLSHVLVSLDDRSAIPARMGAFFVSGDSLLDIYSTDDNTISWLSINKPDGYNVNSPYIVVPTGFLQQLLKLRIADQDQISLALHEGMSLAVNDTTGVMVIANLVDCPNLPDFVDELSRFQENDGYEIPDELSAALDRILLMPKTNAAFEVDRGKLKISIEKDIGNLYEEMEIVDHPQVSTLFEPELVYRALKDRSSILISRNAMCLKGPENFVHLIAASRPATE